MVENSYEFIAEDYDLKRRKPWNALGLFIKMIVKYCSRYDGVILDLGCGNARNIPLIKNNTNKVIGIDKSLKLLKIAKKSQIDNPFYDDKQTSSIELINCDFLYMPLRENTLDFTFSIASFHHIKGKHKRKVFVSEIHKLLKRKGYLIITVWRKYQKKYKWYFFRDYVRRRFFPSYHIQQEKLGLPEYGDKYISWTIAKKNKKIERFYHLFSIYEIKKLLSPFQIKFIKKMGGPNKKDNIFILAQKTS